MAGPEAYNQPESVWKASLKCHVLSCLQNINREGASHSSSRRWLHKVSATAEKALPLVYDLQASLGVATQRSIPCKKMLGRTDDMEKRHS